MFGKLFRNKGEKMNWINNNLTQLKKTSFNNSLKHNKFN